MRKARLSVGQGLGGDQKVKGAGEDAGLPRRWAGATKNGRRLKRSLQRSVSL
jgi:hypothetical protein